MKKLLLILILLGLISGHVNAADLIFKQGFENTALVTSTAIGLTSTGLSLKLTVNTTTETLAVDSNGEFVFYLDVAIGDTWSVVVETLPFGPQQQGCSLINPTGIMPTGGADVLQINCNNTAWNWDEMNWQSGGWN